MHRLPVHCNKAASQFTTLYFSVLHCMNRTSTFKMHASVYLLCNCILWHFVTRCNTVFTFKKFSWIYLAVCPLALCDILYSFALLHFHIFGLSLPGGVSSGTLTCRSPSFAPAKVHAGPAPATRNALNTFLKMLFIISIISGGIFFQQRVNIISPHWFDQTHHL